MKIMPSGSGAPTLLLAASLLSSCSGGTSEPVVTPPVTASAHPNEPAGFSQIVSEPFDSLNIAGWSKSPSWASRGEIQVDPDAPGGGAKKVKRFLLANGFTGDNDAGTASRGWTPVRQIYVSLWFKPKAGWQVDRIGNQKIFLVGTSQLASNYTMFVAAWKSDGQMSAGLQPVFPMVNSGGSNRGTTTCAAGAWCHIEVYMKGNTQGQADGILRYWTNGTLVADHSNMQYCQTCAGTFQGMNLAFVWGTTGDVKTQSDFVDYDDLYVSGIP